MTQIATTSANMMAGIENMLIRRVLRTGSTAATISETFNTASRSLR